MIPGAAYLMKLPPAERREAVGRAIEAAREKAVELGLAKRAKAPDPRNDIDYMLWHKQRAVAVPMVKHFDRPSSLQLSRDGADRPHTFINPARIEIQPESTDRLLLIVINRRLVGWIREKHGVDLCAVPPTTLIGDWSDEDAAKWTALRNIASRINMRICLGKSGRYRRQHILTRDHAA